MDEPVYTVFQSLQDEYVAKNLQLDLGSLPAFLDLRSTDAVPLLGGGQCRKFQSKRKYSALSNLGDWINQRSMNNPPRRKMNSIQAMLSKLSSRKYSNSTQKHSSSSIHSVNLKKHTNSKKLMPSRGNCLNYQKKNNNKP